MALEKFLTPGEVAAILGMSLGYTRNMIRRGIIPGSRLGGEKRGLFRVRESDLDAYVQSRKVTPPTDPKTGEGSEGDE